MGDESEEASLWRNLRRAEELTPRLDQLSCDEGKTTNA